jgi:endogenous inhibitor of DNA gyrase (YacG/DUF329 family)
MPNSNVVCLQCETQYTKTKKHQKFCSPKCRLDYWLKMNPRVPLAQSSQKAR